MRRIFGCFTKIVEKKSFSTFAQTTLLHECLLKLNTLLLSKYKLLDGEFSFLPPRFEQILATVTLVFSGSSKNEYEFHSCASAYQRYRACDMMGEWQAAPRRPVGYDGATSACACAQTIAYAPPTAIFYATRVFWSSSTVARW